MNLKSLASLLVNACIMGKLQKATRCELSGGAHQNGARMHVRATQRAVQPLRRAARDAQYSTWCYTSYVRGV
jgi:hypothetical protein